MASDTVDLIQDLLAEILVRLPVKSILRSKATCKRWRSFIQSPSFINFHRHRHRLDYQDRRLFSEPSRHPFCFLYSCASLSDDNEPKAMFHLGWIPRRSFTEWIPRIPSSSRSDTTVLGPLDNGIYCVIHKWSRPWLSSISVGITLCNLTTRDYKYVTPLPSEAAAFISSNPSRMHCGFGPVRSEDGLVVDYKVVVMFHVGEGYSRFMSFVYSLRRRTWNEIANEKGVDPPRHIMNYSLEQCPQLFLNGSWHWLDISGGEYDRVLAFDVHKDVFGWIEGPPLPGYHAYDTDRTMLLLNDQLVVIHLSRVRNSPCEFLVDVWMMTEYGIKESWTKIFSFQETFKGGFLRIVGLSYSTTNGQSSHIEKMFFTDGARLLSYNGSEFMMHGPYWQNQVSWNTLGISSYIETLEPLSFSSE